MPSITLSTGQVSDPIEIGPGTRVTAVGGYVQWTTGTIADARNGVATWQNWPAGAVAATEDTLRRVVIRAVATGAMTLTWDESRQDVGADGAYWQEQVPSWATDANGNAALTASDGGAAGIPVVSAAAMTVRVSPFTAGQWSFAGGSISVPSNGTWFVGVEMWSGVLRCLPRLGHRGWVPVARVVAAGGAITTVQQIAPEVPASRIPNAMRRILSGLPLRVALMGSSLLVSSGVDTEWPGMVFGAGSTSLYKLPGTVTPQYRAVGGAPNHFQLAQLGLASRHTGTGFQDSGYARALETLIPPPNGRTAMLTGVDLVVIGCLANNADYRLQCIEPIVRKLRQRGLEVLLVTDNPFMPSNDYTALTTGALYLEGQEIIRVADLYGCEVADTSAYMVGAYLRAGGVGLYQDSIHPTTGAPAGVAAALPANGAEVWARAVRSIFTVNAGATVVDSVPNRAMESRPLPPFRILSDLRTPGDAFVILPKNEELTMRSNPNRGTLGAHPLGSSSFARLFSPAIGASEDLLTVAPTKSFVISGPVPVGFSFIHYRESGDGPCTFDVYVNGSIVRTITIPAVPFGNEWYQPVYTPTELDASAAGATPSHGSAWDSITIAPTSGTLRIVALIAFTPDMDYVSPEQLLKVGAWLPRENSASGLPGYPTDTNGAYAYTRCTGNRVVWVLSSNPGTKLAEAGSGAAFQTNINFVGTTSIRRTAAFYGPGEWHYIRCIETNASGSQAGGRALHVGGAYIINDR